MDNHTATPMTLPELADAYHISIKVMRKWLKPHAEAIGPRCGHYYTPKQILIIYDRLGHPPQLSVK